MIPSILRKPPPICYQATRSLNLRYLKRNNESIKKLTLYPDLALQHFDGLYSRVYGRAWPSMRLGLLSTKKQCAMLNSFVDKESLHKQFVEELGAIDLQRYYKKHLQSYTRYMLRQQIIENKKARKRELMAKNQNVDPEAIDLNTIEVSDVSDSELKGYQSTDASDSFSQAEDLAEMFSDRRMDDDEKYFFNQASTQLNLNDYVPATELIYHEEIASDLSYYESYNPDVNLSIEFKDEPSLDWGNELKIYAFPRESWEQFDEPSPVSVVKLMSHYIMDGASVLPVLALDLQLNDICADYCAAPGGKSLAMLMTLRPKYLLCNDSSASRLARLTKTMQQYCPDVNYVNSTVERTKYNARGLIRPDMFDKILVDVPCSNDRHSVEAIENNIFKRTRTEERLGLPNVQCDILKAALKSLKPKGSVVYSTCTMSPVENDGVVQKALLQLQEEGIEAKYAIVNLKEAFRPLRGLFKFNTKFKYGQQVLPNLQSNFGPMYISKIKRLS